MDTISGRNFEGLLYNLLSGTCPSCGDTLHDDDITVETFEEAGVMTKDRGLFVKINGTKFLVTIYQVG